MTHKYNTEQVEWIRYNRDNYSYTELALMFNDKFNACINADAISNVCSRHKIKCSTGHVNRGQFKKGHKTWNDGLKDVNGSSLSRYKKGIIPYNQLPIGSERIKCDGYIEVKVNHGKNQWKAKNRIIWEQYNGKVPPNHVVIFLDSNTINCDIENLSCISRAELVQLNKKDNLKSQSPEIKKALINVVRFELAVNKVNRKLKEV